MHIFFGDTLYTQRAGQLDPMVHEMVGQVQQAVVNETLAQVVDEMMTQVVDETMVPMVGEIMGPMVDVAQAVDVTQAVDETMTQAAQVVNEPHSCGAVW